MDIVEQSNSQTVVAVGTTIANSINPWTVVSIELAVSAGTSLQCSTEQFHLAFDIYIDLHLD